MTQANDSFQRTPDGTGTLLATHAPGDGKEYPVSMLAEPDGHIQGSKPAFGFVVPPAAVGAGKTYFDLFNNQASTVVNLRKLFAIVATDVAVTGALGVRLDSIRTSAVGTGGTAFAADPSASTTAAAWWKFDTAQAALPTGVTGRNTPTGGATAQAWLWPSYVFTEETNMSSHMPQFFNLVPEMPFNQPLSFPTGIGFKVTQGTVASVGNIGFMGVVTIE